MVPLVFWNHPAVVALALAVGVFLNPAGNAGIGAYRVAVTPASCIGRVQAHHAVRVDVDHAAGTGRWPAHCSPRSAARRRRRTVALCALVALIPTLSRSVRAIPRPADWAKTGDDETPAAELALA